ncbi:FUSC family protein [Terrimonas sp. NA20]|uniref:FUSC family protein n=1 Tax=Terrimonas ginsenosidimutans TaxID=2908004 RepID=A0ABS9KW57_9BACT|nr:FUSC family membrane protein [Terrimonas ginsenosidimutans]MCG2616604.1 FUSC family protein [Terrimonas ginsenosidimutans]
MDYIKEYRRFIYSHYLADGVRITAGVLLPSLILGYYGHLQLGIFISLGALCVSITDNPGPIHHRRNGLLICSAMIFGVALMVGFAMPVKWLFMVLLPVLCFFFSMIGVYGARATAIGIAALLVMVMMTHESMSGWQVVYFALYILGGGLWYTGLSLVLYSLRPYKLIQQAMGEYVLSAATYLRARAGFYAAAADIDESYSELMHAQIDVQQKQDLVAELLFKTRSIVKESTHTSRILMMVFLDVSDLLERAMTSHQDYRKLHSYFDDTGILPEYGAIIRSLADEMDEIGLSLISGKRSGYDTGIDKELVTEREHLQQLRVKSLNPANLEGFISLRHILDSIDDIAARIRTLHQYTSYDRNLKRIKNDTPDPSKYVTRQTIDPQQFWDNFSLNSNIFRHSLRITIAAFAAFIIGQLLPFGRGYWILLTVIVILKPGYTLTRQRNIQRLVGTVIGAAIAGGILFFVKNNTAILVLLALSMIGGYSFMRWKYLASVVMITMYLLFMFHILEPDDFREVVQERIVDTLIGCIVGFIASYLLPPIWEREQIGELMRYLVSDIIQYFESVAYAFTGAAYDQQVSKEKRKAAWVSLANVTDAFNRMLSEPKSKRRDYKEFHRFVVSSHMLVSHFATLTYYADTLQPEYIMPDYDPLIKASVAELSAAGRYLENPYTDPPKKNETNPLALLDQKINALMQTRQQELREGVLESAGKKYLSTFKSITDQFYFVYKTSQDVKKIVRTVGV